MQEAGVLPCSISDGLLYKRSVSTDGLLRHRPRNHSSERRPQVPLVHWNTVAPQSFQYSSPFPLFVHLAVCPPTFGARRRRPTSCRRCPRSRAECSRRPCTALPLRACALRAHAGERLKGCSGGALLHPGPNQHREQSSALPREQGSSSGCGTFFTIGMPPSCRAAVVLRPEDETERLRLVRPT